MSRGVNKFIGIGNLGSDPETRYSSAGNPVTNFSIAIDESYKKDGKEIKKVEWVGIVCFGRLAEIAGEYLKKGSKVYVEGSLSTSSWEKDGQKHYKTEINVRDLKMLSSPQSENRPVGVPAGINKAESSGFDDFDDEPPF